MRGVALGLAMLVAGTVGVPAGPVAACSCAGMTEERQFALAEAVFSGQATDERRMGSGTSSIDPVAFTFRVERATKGTVVDPQPVLTAAEGASCGMRFVVGQRYRVYASSRPGLMPEFDAAAGRAAAGLPNALFTTLCSGNTLADGATPEPARATVAVAAAPAVAEDVRPDVGASGTTIALVGLVSLLGGAAGILAARRGARRRR